MGFFSHQQAFAWKMNEENFMKNIGWLNSLKLRGLWCNR